MVWDVSDLKLKSITFLLVIGGYSFLLPGILDKIDVLEQFFFFWKKSRKIKCL